MAKIFIDPGHGGTDSGAVGNGLYEKNINLTVALRLRDLLVEAGHIVKLSRESDATVSLSTRSSASNSFGADYFVSVHHNAGGATGYEVIHSIVGGKGLEIAKAIGAEFSALGQEPHGTGIYSRRGDNGDYYGVIRNTAAPANITEFGFIDTADVAAFNTVEKLHGEAEAIAKGICKVLGGTLKSVNTSAPAPAVKPLVKEGSTGEAVVYLQNSLNRLGFSVGTADGDFGPKTKAAVIAFQGANGLTADGIVGAKTWAVVDAKIAALNAPKPISSVLAVGSEGEAVRALQEDLIKLGYLPAGSADGDFGPQTDGAVRRFQSENGLTSDGKVGPMTKAKLAERIAALNTPAPAPTPEPAPAPAPAPEPVQVKVMFRVILDGKQIEAVSSLETAAATVRSAIDTGAAIEGKVQRNTDGAILFTYVRTPEAPKPVEVPAPAPVVEPTPAPTPVVEVPKVETPAPAPVVTPEPVVEQPKVETPAPTVEDTKVTVDNLGEESKGILNAIIELIIKFVKSLFK